MDTLFFISGTIPVPMTSQKYMGQLSLAQRLESTLLASLHAYE